MRLLAIVLLVSPLLAQHWRFPHSRHLEQGLDCRTCHSAATGSREAADNLLPDARLCEACHNGQTAPEIATQPLTDARTAERICRFDHQFHLGLGDAAIASGDCHGKPGDARRFLGGGNACAACHRGLEKSVAVDSAAHLPKMGDCIVCHTRVDNPFSCKQCRIEGVYLRPVDHTREFIDTHATGRIELDKLSCPPCHGRDFPCIGWH
ncbi:MAG: hypothetical protein OXN97_13910 [Bryobacterales bacterium]|nr:hypothetical protein [Bryobacterales bacterium]